MAKAAGIDSGTDSGTDMGKFGPMGLTLKTGELVRWTEVRPGRYQVAKTVQRWTVAHVRVSTDAQVEFGQSLYQQVALAVQTAAREGGAISHVYLDPGLSATRLEMARRPGVSALLKDIRRGVIGTLVLYKRDRIARSAPDWFAILRACVRNDVRVVFSCPGEPPIGHGAYGRFLEALLISHAQLESEVTGMRVRDSHRAALERGQFPGGNLPYGYRRLEDGTIIMEAGEAAVVATIFRLAAGEHLGVNRIAWRLNDECPKSRRGKDWTSGHVLKVLRNRTYCGYFHLCSAEAGGSKQYREVRSDLIPPIVSEVTWSAAEQIRTARRPKAKPNPDYGACSRLLTGLIFCAECGRKMYTRATRGHWDRSDGTRAECRGAVYRCNGGVEQVVCKNRSQISTATVDATVIRALTQHLSRVNIDTLIARVEQRRLQQRQQLLDDLQAVRQDLTRVLDELRRSQDGLEAAAAETAEEHEYVNQVRSLLQRRTDLKTREAEIQHRLTAFEVKTIEESDGLCAATEWSGDVRTLPLADQRQLITRLVERVILHGERRLLDIVLKFTLPLEGASESKSLCSILIRPGKRHN